MALTATKVPASPAPGAFNNKFISDKINEVIDEAAPTQAFKLDRTVAVEYSNTTLPALPATITATVNPALFANDVDITVSFQFSGGGNTYAMFEQTTSTALVANPLVRIARTGQAEGVAGSATMNYWYDNVAGDMKILLDFDGGGKTAVSLTVTSGFNTPVPV